MATKTKSFAYQKNELFKKIASGSHGDSDFNKIIDSLGAVKTGQEEKGRSARRGQGQPPRYRQGRGRRAGFQS